MRFKRLIATALAAAMILGLVSVGFAASFEDTEGFEFEASVLKLADLGIISGYPDGTFKPDNLVTRAEFAKMIVCMLGLESAAESLKGEAVPFADVDADHWAAGYINVAQMMGIVNGYEDGTFRPEGNINYAEALKMVLAAMGYSEDGFLVVRWPATWITKAIELELDKDLTIVSGLPITRGEVAKLFDNSLTKKHVVVKDGEFVERDVTFMSKLKVNYIEGQVIDSPELWTNTSGKVKIDGKTDKDEAKTLSFAIDDYEGLLGHNVRVWYKGSKALGVEVLSTEKLLSKTEYDKIKAADFAKTALFVKNYAVVDEKPAVGTVYDIAVVYDGSTPIAAKVADYTVDVITDIYSYGKRMDVYLKENRPLRLYDFDVEYVGVDGFDDLKEGDILNYIYDDENDKALIIVAGDVVKGTLTEITYDNKIKVDGKTFSVSEEIVEDLKEDLKDEVGKVVVTLYLDKDGKVFNCTWETESAPEAVYGVVQAVALRVVDKKPRTFHKVLTLEGEVEYLWAGSGYNPGVGDVVEIDLEDGEATYEELPVEKAIRGTVVGRDAETDAEIIEIKFKGDTTPYTSTKNTLWVEVEKGKYVERPLPYIDDQVALYLVPRTETGTEKTIAVGIVGVLVDETDPVIKSAKVEKNNGDLVLTVVAEDENLYSLEVDHSHGPYGRWYDEANLPEFTVYADPSNPWGTPEAKAEFERYGVTVDYDADTQTWTITFKSEGLAMGVINDEDISNGAIEFYLVAHDAFGNSSGHMNGNYKTVVYTPEEGGDD